MDKYETMVKLNKEGMIKAIFLCILFIAVTPWVWSLADTQIQFSPVFVKIISILLLLLCAVLGIYFFVKLFDTKPGLIINENGLFENSGFAGIWIKWSDINGIDTENFKGSSILLILVKNPEEYLNEVNVFKRLMMKTNFNSHGTPLIISPDALKCDFDKLTELVNEGIKTFST